jgi:hypothetical protein
LTSIAIPKCKMDAEGWRFGEPPLPGAPLLYYPFDSRFQRLTTANPFPGRCPRLGLIARRWRSAENATPMQTDPQADCV